MNSFVFIETLRTIEIGRRYLWLDEHFDRLENSLASIKSPLLGQLKELKVQLNSLLPFSEEKRIKITCGEKYLFFEIASLEGWDFSNGVIVRDVEFERPDRQYKYETDVYKKYMPKKNDDWGETLFIDKDQNIREGNITNVFVLLGETLVTPPKSVCLAGIARQKVIEYAWKQGISVEERSLSKTEALTASAMFLSNSVRGLIPVKQWNNTVFKKELPFHKPFNF